MVQEINEIQELNFKLIEKTNFNSFNGKRIVELLKQHNDLWEAVIVDRLNSLIKLRDMKSGYWNVDTLFILSTGNICKDNQLRNLLKELNADEVNIVRNASELLGEYPTKKRILTAWWN